MKRARGPGEDTGGESPGAGGTAPGKRARTDSLRPVQRQEAAPGLPAPVRSAPAPSDDPFALHLPQNTSGAADGASDAHLLAHPMAAAPVQLQRAAGPKSAPGQAPAVPDPIVRGAGDAATRLPRIILSFAPLRRDFELARSQLDGDRVGEIGLRLAAAFEAAETALRELDEGVGNAEMLGPVGVDYAHDPHGDKSGAWGAEVSRLGKRRDELVGDLAGHSLIVSNAVRPTSFRRKDVPGAGVVLRAHEMAAFVREQTVKTVLLLDTADEISLMLAGAADQPKDVASALRKEAANRLESWIPDREGFLFLSQVLSMTGHGELLGDKGAGGKKLSDTVEAVTRGVPQTVDDVIRTVHRARDYAVAGDVYNAKSVLGLALERVRELSHYDKVKAALPKGVHGLTQDQALSVIQEAASALEAQWRSLARGERMGEGLWTDRIRTLETAAQFLKVVSGETAFEESFLAAVGPASKTSLITAGIMGGTIIGGAAGGTWLAANAAAVAEVAAGLYAAAVTAIVRNPYAATALAEFAAGLGIQVLEAGSFENFMESLKTPEGVMQLVMDLLVLKQSMGGGRYASDADAPDAQPRRAPDMDEGSNFGAQVRDALDRVRAFKSATIEWAKQRARPGQQTAAVTPDGDTMPVPGRSGGDAAGLGEIYAEALAGQRAARAARGGRRMWPTAETWEAEYHPPPAGKDEVAIREKVLEAAKAKYPVTPDMPSEQQADLHQKQRDYFAKVEANARERREQLEAEAAGLSGSDLAWKEEEIKAARRVEVAAKVKPTQGRLPINHEFAGKAITIDDIDAKLADLTLSAEARVKLQRARKAMVESGVTRIEYTDEGYPDFSPWVYQKNGKKADLEMYLQGTRGKDDALAEKRFGEMINDPDFEAPNGWTWHHSERTGKMLLVPTAIHDAFKHTGGIPLWRVLTGQYDGYRKSGGEDNDDS